MKEHKMMKENVYISLGLYSWEFNALSIYQHKFMYQIQISKGCAQFLINIFCFDKYFYHLWNNYEVQYPGIDKTIFSVIIFYR